MTAIAIGIVAGLLIALSPFAVAAWLIRRWWRG
jgi:hypothetical protein